MPSAGFEPSNPPIERSQTYDLVCMATAIGYHEYTSAKYPYNSEIKTTTSPRINGAALLVVNGEEKRHSTNYSNSCQCIISPDRVPYDFCRYGPAQIWFL
jgi:hypothetical protein